MVDGSPVRFQISGSVGILELNRADKYNCLALESNLMLSEGVSLFTNNEKVRSILVCSSGKHFCTGADLDSVREARHNSESLAKFIEAGHVAMRALEQARIPTVVAVQGMCLAGGLELMMSCDVAFASEDAKFGDQHAEFGLIPGWGGSQRLTRIIGRRRAMDMFYSAKRLDANAALDSGLVNYVCPADQLRSSAIEYCERIGQRSRPGLATIKMLAYDGLDLPLPAGLVLEERSALRALLSDDVSEGLAAFQARRTPNFNADANGIA